MSAIPDCYVYRIFIIVKYVTTLFQIAELRIFSMKFSFISDSFCFWDTFLIFFLVSNFAKLSLKLTCSFPALSSFTAHPQTVMAFAPSPQHIRYLEMKEEAAGLRPSKPPLIASLNQKSQIVVCVRNGRKERVAILMNKDDIEKTATILLGRTNILCFAVRRACDYSRILAAVVKDIGAIKGMDMVPKYDDIHTYCYHTKQVAHYKVKCPKRKNNSANAKSSFGRKIVYCVEDLIAERYFAMFERLEDSCL